MKTHRWKCNLGKFLISFSEFHVCHRDAISKKQYRVLYTRVTSVGSAQSSPNPYTIYFFYFLYEFLFSSKLCGNPVCSLMELKYLQFPPILLFVRKIMISLIPGLSYGINYWKYSYNSDIDELTSKWRKKAEINISEECKRTLLSTP